MRETGGSDSKGRVERRGRTQGSHDRQESESRCGCIVRVAVLENEVALGRATIAELLERVKELERKNTADKRTQDELQEETVGKRVVVRRPKPKKVLRSEVTLPLSVNKTIDSRLDGGKHFESNCTCWQGQTAADCEKDDFSLIVFDCVYP